MPEMMRSRTGGPACSKQAGHSIRTSTTKSNFRRRLPFSLQEAASWRRPNLPGSLSYFDHCSVLTSKSFLSTAPPCHPSHFSLPFSPFSPPTYRSSPTTLPAHLDVPFDDVPDYQPMDHSVFLGFLGSLPSPSPGSKSFWTRNKFYRK